ncbi:MAG: hypothetical protein JSW50_05725 [Candidatus Latescibacterota bacterium]|nr:MAG: hypothetical protein JSW50_05725 [Candidatus Latescibacterota bacterium]
MNIVRTTRSRRLYSSILSCVTAFALVICQFGCTYYAADMTEDAVDAVYPDGKWELVPLSEVVGSEDAFKDKRMMFHLANGGHNDVKVERIDSTFVYAWSLVSEDTPKHLTKIRLRNVAEAEIWVGAVKQYKWHHWALIPIVVVVFVTVVVVVALWEIGAW